MENNEIEIEMKPKESKDQPLPFGWHSMESAPKSPTDVILVTCSLSEPWKRCISAFWSSYYGGSWIASIPSSPRLHHQDVVAWRHLPGKVPITEKEKNAFMSAFAAYFNKMQEPDPPNDQKTDSAESKQPQDHRIEYD